jgi:hypothetical protein
VAVTQLVMEFEQDKETPGTIRYAEVADGDGKYASGLFDGPAIGTQYVKKYAAAKLGNPKKIIVTITASA